MTFESQFHIFEGAMRERTVKVDRQKLANLSSLYRPTRVAAKLDISKQRWRHYETGKNDLPESLLQKLCVEFDLSEKDLILQP